MCVTEIERLDKHLKNKGTDKDCDGERAAGGDTRLDALFVGQCVNAAEEDEEEEGGRGGHTHRHTHTHGCRLPAITIVLDIL